MRLWKWADANYIILQDVLPVEETGVWERALGRLLAPMPPPSAFVEQLEQALLQEAQEQLAPASPAIPHPSYLGWIIGGALSLMGGLLAWWLWRQIPLRGALRPSYESS